MRNFPLFLLLAVFVFSCQEENLTPVTSEPEVTRVTPRDGFDHAPEQSGFIVTRGDGSIGMVFRDFRTGLTVVAGFAVAEFCDPFPNENAFQLVPTQQVDIPNDPLRFHALHKGEVYYEIYEGVISIDDFICDFVQTAPLLASGMAHTVGTDNDLAIYLREDPKNKNAFGFIGKGTLTDPAGDPVAFKVVYRAVWDGFDFASFKEAIKITLG